MPDASGPSAVFAAYCLRAFSAADDPLLHKLSVAHQSSEAVFAAHADSPLVSALAFNHFVRQRLREAPSTAARGTRFKDDHNDTCMYIERSKNLNVVAYTVNYVGTAAFTTTRLTTPSPETPADSAEAQLQPPSGAREVNAKDPIRAYWIKIEPEHVARRRGRGEMEDICSLSMIEKKLAYGCTAAAYDKGAEARLLEELLGTKVKLTTDIRADAQANVVAWLKAFSPCKASFVAISSWPVVVFSLPPLPDVTTAAGAASTTTPPFPSPTTTIPVMLAEVNKEMSILHKVYVKSIEPKHFYQLPSVEYIEVFGVSLSTGKETYEKRKP